MRLFFFMLVAAAASAARAGDDLSFAAPFDAVAATGDRQVSPAWRAHGSAAVHRNFARLTPDRQSKAGALWSAESVGADQATLELTFRISGQGQHFFGDGLALWLSADRAFRAGAFHGADPRFAGVAVVADTFRNDEAAAAHRDLALVASGGGAADAAALLEGAAGCDASVRYHENRGDFSVDRSSRVRLAVAAGTATLAVDAANDGTWVECAAVALPPALDGAWLRRAHVGVTASTGQLADNHDVLALAVRTDGAPAAPAADAPAAAAAAAAAAAWTVAALMDEEAVDARELLKLSPMEAQAFTLMLLAYDRGLALRVQGILEGAGAAGAPPVRVRGVAKVMVTTFLRSVACQRSLRSAAGAHLVRPVPQAPGGAKRPAAADLAAAANSQLSAATTLGELSRARSGLSGPAAGQHARA